MDHHHFGYITKSLVVRREGITHRPTSLAEAACKHVEVA
jgi:hypothetical protein